MPHAPPAIRARVEHPNILSQSTSPEVYRSSSPRILTPGRDILPGEAFRSKSIEIDGRMPPTASSARAVAIEPGASDQVLKVQGKRGWKAWGPPAAVLPGLAASSSRYCTTGSLYPVGTACSVLRLRVQARRQPSSAVPCAQQRRRDTPRGLAEDAAIPQSSRRRGPFIISPRF